LTKLEQ